MNVEHVRMKYCVDFGWENNFQYSLYSAWNNILEQAQKSYEKQFRKKGEKAQVDAGIVKKAQALIDKAKEEIAGLEACEQYMTANR